MKTLLHNHTSPETAHVVDDYPYGFRLRCKIRYWLEHKPRFGYRFVSQTTNPKKTLPDGSHPWNKPKAGCYDQFAVLYLDSQNHVHVDALGFYSSPEKFALFRQEYSGQMSPAQTAELDGFEKFISRYDPKAWAEWNAKQLQTHTTNPVVQALVTASEPLT